MQQLASFILVYLVFPVWVAAGFADWACHRRTGIAHTSGLTENLLHLLMFVEVGVALVAIALLEINAAVLALVGAVFLVHQLTVYWDLAYSTLLRDVGPFEQMVHSFLELLPLMALVLLSLLAWPQALAMVGLGAEAAQWSLVMKSEPLPRDFLLGAAALVLVFNLGPLLQETGACLRARHQTKAAATTRRVEPRL